MFGNTSQVIYKIDHRDIIMFVGGDGHDSSILDHVPEADREGMVGRNIWEFIVGGTARYLYGLILERVRMGKTISFERHWDQCGTRRTTVIVIRPSEGGDILFESIPVSHDDSYVPPEILHSGNFDPELIVTCSWCHRIRVETKSWCDVEEAISVLGMLDVDPPPQLSHGMCGDCFGSEIDKLRK